jgi:hypothetical protein
MSSSGDPVLPQVSDLPAEGDEVFVNLPSGKPLREQGASDLLRAQPTPVVVLAGAAKSGKTTLLASLHDAFQRTPFAGFLAAGSRTLMGFEERCFDSRAASGAEEPTTLRTRPAEGLLFYHMKLRNEDLKTPIKHILLGDMSGEHYSAAMDSAPEARALKIVRSCDSFVHLIDGAMLASKNSRAHAQANAMMLMRRFFEEGMFESDAKIDILITKWDMVLAICGVEEAAKILKVQQKTYVEYLGPKIARLRVKAIAARPGYQSPLKPGFGLDDLLRSWVDEPPRKLEAKPRLLPIPTLETEFDRFAVREAPELFERPTNE